MNRGDESFLLFRFKKLIFIRWWRDYNVLVVKFSFLVICYAKTSSSVRTKVLFYYKLLVISCSCCKCKRTGLNLVSSLCL